MSESNQSTSAPLPSGTVTFLLSDVEGSTRLYEQYPEPMQQAMARHDALFEHWVPASSGQLIRPRGEGDSRFAVFGRATDAVAAARNIQQAFAAEPWPTPSPIRVRMALHTGEADIREGDYYGSDVNRCARVRSLAYGGQVLLSQSTTVLVRDALPAGVALRDLGEHRLKDLQRPEHVFQLVLAGLPSDFPTPKSLDALPNNLPPQLTSFVGRQRELREAKALLSRTHLLTLTGPGGTGKTRLSLQVAGELLDQFKDGVWFVDLSALADAALVGQVIARTLGLRDTGEQPVREMLLAELRDKELLLILDNFEQVIDAALLVKDLLIHAPRLKCLVTSRSLLRVTGEQEYEVPQFALPDPRRLPPLEQLSQYDAVRLFIERARAYKPDWTITNENAPAVAEICFRLDALPLAIELAAARIRLLPPAKILAQLDNRLDFLKSPARDLPIRQQTLRGAIAWSYNLLSIEERALFRRLAVFAGGATLEAAEAVCSLGETVDVLAGLESLAGNSLIRQVNADGEPRYLMLETIRDYAAARLGEDPSESSAVRRAHAAFFADLTRSQWEPLMGKGRETALLNLGAELENIGSAWHTWLAERNLEQLGKFVDCLVLFYDAKGWYQATVDLTSDLLAVLTTAASTAERAREELTLQMSLARALMIVKGYYSADAEQAYARALELCEREGDNPESAPILRALSRYYLYRGDIPTATHIGEQILGLAQRQGDSGMQLDGNLVVGSCMSLLNPKASLPYLDKAIELFQLEAKHTHPVSLGANPGVVSLTTSALVLWASGSPDRARRRAANAMTLAKKLEHPFSLSYAHHHYGLLHLWLREPQISIQHAEALLALAGEHEFQVWSAVGCCLDGAALADTGSPEEGLALLQRGITAYQGRHTPPVFFPLLLYLQSGAYHQAKRPAEGLDVLDRAIQMQMGPSVHEDTALAQFYRLKGQLLMEMGPGQRGEAERWLQQSRTMAIHLDAAMLELCAALSLARLLQGSAQAGQGRQWLNDAYGKITEGFETADLVEAKTLLEES